MSLMGFHTRQLSKMYFRGPSELGQLATKLFHGAWERERLSMA